MTPASREVLTRFHGAMRRRGQPVGYLDVAINEDVDEAARDDYEAGIAAGASRSARRVAWAFAGAGALIVAAWVLA